MRYVKYVGLAHQRMITPADWRSVGLNRDTVVWNARNGFAVPLDMFDEDMLRKAVDSDDTLVISGDDEDFSPKPQITDMTPAQLVQTTETPVDVVAVMDGEQTVSRDESGASVVSPVATPGGRPIQDNPQA